MPWRCCAPAGRTSSSSKATFASTSRRPSPPLRPANERETQPTLGFQRVLQRSLFHVQSSGKKQVTGANVLVALFGEREAHAAYLLNRQSVTGSTS